MSQVVALEQLAVETLVEEVNCQRHSDAPARDIIAFLDALIFNFLIGNNDAHSKNYSLLLDGPGAIRVAPLYDLVSMPRSRERAETWR